MTSESLIRLLDAAFNSILQATLLCAVAALASRLLRLAPGARQRLYELVLVSVAALFTATATGFEPSSLWRRAPVATAMSPSPEHPVPAVEPGAEPVSEERWRIPVALELPERLPVSSGVLQAFAALWAAGLALSLLRTCAGIQRVRRLRRNLSAAPQSLCDSAAVLVRACARTRACGVRTTAQPVTAMLLGYAKPLVVIPEWMLAKLDESEMRHVLAHELAHAARYDDWAKLAQRLLTAPLWFNPVLKFLNERIDVERELACDARAASVDDPRAYARTLARLAEAALQRVPSTAPAADVRPGDLLVRVRSLVRPRASRLHSRLAFVPAFLVLLCVVPLTAAPSWFRTIDALARVDVTEIGTDTRALDAALRAMESRGFAGAVVVARDGSLTFQGGYGYADRARKAPHDERTLYSVAGVTKALTATAVLRLASEGKLDLDEPIARFFPELPAAKRRATIRQLLLHEAGLVERGVNVQRATREKFIRAVSAAPADFEPGAAERYTDIGYSVLAAIVEVASGEQFEGYVRRTQLTPAGMRDTRFEDEITPTDLARLSFEYSRAGEAVGLRPYVWGRRGALGLVTTLGDIAKWDAALQRGDLLTPDARQQLEAGLGFDPTPLAAGGYVLRRLGGTPTMQIEYMRVPQSGTTIVFVINNRIGWHRSVWEVVRSSIFNTQPRGSVS